MFAVISDTHFGIKNFNREILDSHLSYFKNVFFKYLLDNNIKLVFHLGDLVDDRQFIDYYSMNRVQEEFLDFFENNSIKLYLILGNHDLFYKNDSSINCLSLTKNYKMIVPVKKSLTVIEDNLTFNLVSHGEIIPNVKADFLLTHTDTEILDNKEALNNNNRILSGHIHKPITISNNNTRVTFVGVPYHLDWSNFNTEVGFYLYDETKDSLSLISNNYSPKFIKIYYSNNESTVEGIPNVSKMNDSELINLIHNNYCKVYLKDNLSAKKFQLFQDTIINSINDIHFEFTEVPVDTENFTIKIDNSNILDIVSSYFDKTKNPKAKEIKQLFVDKFNQFI